ncbi:MAG: NAD(P)/FAD-dependent oxidoreductase [Deltaproteobacteria bacterium]|nr:NAD(P)/FAD-dependent oxidoreductase [Deltaproteobacteria bacterium]
MEAYDVMIIGSGTAGQTVAYDLVEKGLKVAVVERSPQPGGTCALSGCQPKKYYYEVMETIARCRHLTGKGVVSPPAPSWAQVRAEKNAFISRIPDRTVEGFKTAGITFLRGTARFQDEETLLIDRRPVRALHYVLAVGATPMPLPFEGSELLMTSDRFLEIPHLPPRIVFVGGGFISFEFAHFTARLRPEKVDVHILEAMDRPLGAFDGEMVQLLIEASQEENIIVHTGMKIVSVRTGGEGYTLTAESGRRFQADLIVHGAGRLPQIQDLNLDAAGIAHSKNGITVDGWMRTSNPKVYAVGDCAATIQLARVADYEAHVAAEAIASGTHGAGVGPVNYEAVPSILFTYPQYGMVGKTEEALKREGIDYRRSAGDHLGWPTYRRIGMKHAAYKILADNEGVILGAHFLGDHTTGLVNTVRHAMVSGMAVEELYLQGIMSPYPSRESDLIYMLKPLVS